MAEYYLLIKTAHLWAVLASGIVFALRGVLMLARQPAANHVVLRYLSYSIDTTLLTAAMMLLVILRLNPFTTPWLALKLTFLVAYVVFGALALRHAQHYRQRVIFFIAALACFGWMFGIARAHHPLGWFRWFHLV